MCSFIIPQITHVHPLGVRCDLRTSSLTSSQLFPASDFEEVELMTVPPVATATDVGLGTVAKDLETEETDWDTEGMEGFDVIAMEGFDTEGMEGFDTEGMEEFDTEGTEGMEEFDTEGMEEFDTEGMEGLDTEGMEGFDTEEMEGLDVRDNRDDAGKMDATEGFTDWRRRLRFRSRKETKSEKAEFRLFHRELYSCDHVLV